MRSIPPLTRCRLRPALLLGLSLLPLASCGSRGAGEEETTYADVRNVELPDEIQSGETVVMMRLIDGDSTDTEVYEALNTILQRLEISDLLTRGGLPQDDQGNLVPIGAGGDASDPSQHPELLAGTSIEQVRAFLERTLVDVGGPFPQSEAVDACGNPMIASFVPPSQVAEAAVGDPTEYPSWPETCGDDTSCDTLEPGKLEAFFTQTRTDGLMDMVVSISPDPLAFPRKPGLYGHLMGFFISDGGPGFTDVPLVVNGQQFDVELKNMWQRQAQYDNSRGAQQVFAFPHDPRVVYADEISAQVAAMKTQDCQDAWEDNYVGVTPHGCVESAPLLVDRNSPSGEEVWSVWMEDGVNPTNLNQIADIFHYQLKAAAACPQVPFGSWTREGPLEMIVCAKDDGSKWECLAKQDMEDGACFPLEEGISRVRPVMETEVLSVPVATHPVVLEGWEWLLYGGGTGDTGTSASGTGDTGATGTGDTGAGATGTGDTGATKTIPPFAGVSATIELEVTADSVLYLHEPERISQIVGPGGPVELPEALANTHCEESGPNRYDLGEAWPAGTYTMKVPWSDLEPDLFLHHTSVASWVKYWE